MRFRCSGPDDTHAAARALADCVSEEGLVLALVGPLGAGKTAFVKGLAEGLGLDPAQVSSPTFVIANQFATPDGRALAHVDLYRLETESDLDGIGFADMLEPGAVVAVEWADRLPGALPPDVLEDALEWHQRRPPVVEPKDQRAHDHSEAPLRLARLRLGAQLRQQRRLRVGQLASDVGGRVHEPGAALEHRLSETVSARF